ncbi:MAG: hypothetical protein ISR55_08605 [Bacteroidetes bacterium]|nr:hypothetical protein [Bacteroidota bacterium]
MKRLIIVMTAVVLLFSNCRKDKPDWQPEILIPFINSSLDIGDLLADSLIRQNTDSSLVLVYRYVFDAVHFDEILRIPDTTLTKTVTLKTIKLGTRVIETSVTLGQLARQNGAQGALLLAAHGLSIPVPPISNSSGGVVNLDATNMFQTIDIKKGHLTTTVFNGLPIELNNVILELRNKNSGSIILNDTIAVILPSDSFIKVYPLDGKTFEGELEAEVLNISSPGTGSVPVKIDTNDAVDISIKIQVDEVSAATAIFPAQNLIDQTDDVEYHLNGPELNFMQIKTGLFKFIVSSTLQDSGFIDYSIPGATYKGITPLYLEMVIPPAMKGDTTFIEETRKVDDYWYDLTGKDGTQFNSFEQELILRIDSTGKMMDLSLSDSIYIFYTLYDVIPEYVSGYLGKDSFHFQGELAIDLFKRIQADELKISDLKLKIYVENEVGADAEVVIHEISAFNSRKGTSKSLQASNLSNPLQVIRATDNPLTASTSTRELDNSNANELLELLPDKLSYDVNVRINPNGNTGGHTDFIYNRSKVDAGLEVELPLNLSSKGLILLDTLDFDFTKQRLYESIVSGEFKVFVENKFPLDVSMQLYFTDESYQKLDSLFSTPARIDAAVENASAQRVYHYKDSKISALVPESMIRNIRDARYVLVEAVFNTKPDGQQVKIYEDYKLNVKVIADFIYGAKL